MKILIIGSNGFIGSNLKKGLTNKGYDVYGADIQESNEAKYYSVSSSEESYLNLFKQFGNDLFCCINASGAANVGESFHNPVNDYLLNVTNVSRLLFAIRKHSIKCKFINFSSAAVYGNPQKLPISETVDTIPISPYGYHKVMSEYLLKEFADIFNLKTISLRVFSVYGNGLKKQLFWDLGNKVSSSSKAKLFGTGGETRDFIHISDLQNAVEIVMNKSDFDGSVLNVSAGEELTIKFVAELFSTIMLGENVIEFTGEIHSGNPSNWSADITKLKSLGYISHKTIEKGLSEYIEWYKKENLK